MKSAKSLMNFDARRVAHYEKENYVAYYRKDWLELLRVSVSLVRETFSLSWMQAAFGAYLVARAEIAFAPFPDNDVPKAEAYMTRFYELVKHVHGAELDARRAAALDVGWWIVHRRLFGNARNQELAEALQTLYAVAYGVDPHKVQPAAALRAEGMLYSDLWVNEGKLDDSPLLAREEQALYQSYVALQQALA
jgi:hypothetical protein